MTDETQFEYEWTEYESPSHAVISGVAAIEGVSTTELSPLYKSVDPDALNGVFDAPEAASEPDVRVSFLFMDYEVTVERSGLLTLSGEPESADALLTNWSSD